MSSDPEELADTATSEIDERGWTSFIRDYGFGTVFLAIIFAFVEVINNLGETVMAPFQAFADGMAELIRETLFAPADVLNAGAQATVNSFLEGASAALGPAAMPVAMISVVVTLYIFQRFWSRVSFSPIGFLTSLR